MSTTTGPRSQISHRAVVAQTGIGVTFGLAALFLAGVLSSLGLYGEPPLRVTANILAGLIAGLSVVLGTRWPVFGMAAGITMLIAILLAALSGISSNFGGATDFFSMLASGLQSALSYALGAVLLSAALVTRALQAHHRADVRILNALNEDVHELAPVEDDHIVLRTLGDVMRAPEPPLVERRTNRDDIIVAARGWGSAGRRTKDSDSD